MKRVGILGGTFNPPHIGHLMIANEVLHALALDEVRLMPNAIPPHKQHRHDATPEQRVKMLELFIGKTPNLSVETIELERGGRSYTYETMRMLREREPDAEFYFIIGGDSIDYLHTWYRIDDLMELVTFVGVNRPGTQAKSTYAVQMVYIPEIDLSSTIVRQRLATNGTVNYLLATEVIDYIREEGLYGTREITRSN